LSTIGARIKETRKALGYTQQKFADTLGLKQNTVATYEMDKTKPSDRTIADICDKFNVNRTWLETGAGEPFQQKTRDEQIAEILTKAINGHDDARDRLIRAFCQLPDELFPAAERILDEIVANLQKERG
jgi:transcriptional regulator with XRE-family HTH domain